MICTVCFLMQSRTTCQVWHYPWGAESKYINHQSRKCSYRIACRPTLWRQFLNGFSLFQLTLVCVNLTTNHHNMCLTQCFTEIYSEYIAQGWWKILVRPATDRRLIVSLRKTYLYTKFQASLVYIEKHCPH